MTICLTEYKTRTVFYSNRHIICSISFGAYMITIFTFIQFWGFNNFGIRTSCRRILCNFLPLLVVWDKLTFSLDEVDLVLWLKPVRCKAFFMTLSSLIAIAEWLKWVTILLEVLLMTEISTSKEVLLTFIN